jgi:penicillin-binding protein A
MTAPKNRETSVSRRPRRLTTLLGARDYSAMGSTRRGRRQSVSPRIVKLKWLAGGALIVIAAYGAAQAGFLGETAKLGLTKARLAQAMADPARFFTLPETMELPNELAPAGHTARGTEFTAQLKYAFDPALQKEMEGLFQSYRPDYGAFVAMDAVTGRVLSMVSFSQDGRQENLALRATFPSASVFKVVTAAAAIEVNRFSADTVIPFNGRNHTLYRSNVMSVKQTRWTRYITLKDAFAQSVNTVFGRIGAFTVGPEELRQYASRFGFNRVIAADVPMQPGKATIPDDSFGVAESASGFTRDNTMSPMQGALIASAIANDGAMMEPFIVESVLSPDGTPIYQAQPMMINTVVDPATAAEIRKLMSLTVKRGTASGSFRRFFRNELADLEVGGKTGSLTGTDPKGRYDWFVGFASNGKRRIAVAALTVHEKLWRVKSSWLARRAFEKVFADPDKRPSRKGRRSKERGLATGPAMPPLVLAPEFLGPALIAHQQR